MTDENNNGQPTPQNPATPPANGGENKKLWTRERSEQAQRAGQRKLLAGLGFDVPEDAPLEDVQQMVESVKGIMGEHKTLKQAQLTETERAAAVVNEAQTALEKAERRAKEAEDRAASLEAARIDDKIDGKLSDLARSLNAEHSDDVVKFLRDNHTSAVVALYKDDAVNEKDAAALVEEARKARPTWFKSGGPGSPSNRGGKASEPNATLKQQAAQELKRQIKRMT